MATKLSPAMREAKVRVRNNAWKFLECALTMEYGEDE